MKGSPDPRSRSRNGIAARDIAAVALAAIAVAGCRPSQAGEASCGPGNQVLVACGCEGLGMCAERPDPVLRVCDGSMSEAQCGWDTQLGENDDGEGCGNCPIVRVICPPSGRLLVVPSSWYPEEIVRCDWAIRESPP